MKFWKNLVFITLPVTIVTLLLLEALFTWVIPASDPPRGYFDEKNKLYCYSNEVSDGIRTIGKASQIRAGWSINNMNWNYPIDYDTACTGPLIAVIGDSFVSALEVDVDKNFPFLLRSKIQGEYEVYAFGRGGAPLSQYLHMSRYVNRYFDPDILIFNIVHNDFDESIQNLYPHRSFMLQIALHQNDTLIEVQPRPNYAFSQYKSGFHPKSLVYRSALFRYLYLNLKTSNTLQQFLRAQKNQGFEANINKGVAEANQELIIRVTDYIVSAIAKENEGKRIIFMMDAHRDAIYNDRLEKSGVRWMNQMMQKICHSHNVEFIDLTMPMKRDFEQNGLRFNSPLDGHWNEHGHHIAAEVLYNHLSNSIN